jgi:uncharacterized protein YlaI
MDVIYDDAEDQITVECGYCEQDFYISLSIYQEDIRDWGDSAIFICPECAERIDEDEWKDSAIFIFHLH